MNSVSYENLSSIPLMSYVEFVEYVLDRHENKKIQSSVKGKLQRIIMPEEKLSIDEIKMYYPSVPDRYYVSISQEAFIRLVIEVGTDSRGMVILRTVSTNKYYMMVELQEVKYTDPQIPEIDVLRQSTMGFNSYDFGEKFKY